MACIICNDNNPLKAVQKFPTYSVLECQTCKFAIVDPIPSSETLDRLYNSVEYYDTHMNYNFASISAEEIERNIKFNETLHLSNLKNYIKAGDSLLEIGSGGGFALKAFKNKGLNVTGVETSKVAQEFCEKTLGVQVVNSSFEDFQTEKKYDIIMLNHVLEHFLEPKSALEKLRGLLKQNGILYIRVPDHDSYDRRVYGSKWPAYAHYHISNFSQDSLINLFSQYNLEVVESKKYISERVPKKIRSILARTPLKKFFINKFNGRTITIIGRAL